MLEAAVASEWGRDPIQLISILDLTTSVFNSLEGFESPAITTNI
jgi:hypothetical protein